MFTTDSRAENLLDQIGVKWEYGNEFSFSQLKNSWTLENLGRSQAVVPEAVDRYHNLMVELGSPAPAPILWRNPASGAYDVLDGVQRLLAEERQTPRFFSAYVAITESLAMVQKIRVFANYRIQGGFQEASEWTLERAVTLLVDKGIMTPEEVAKWGGWKVATVRDKWQVCQYRRAIAGVGGPERVTDKMARLYAQHAELKDFAAAPDIVAKLANTLHQAQLTATEAEPYVATAFNLPRSRSGLYSKLAHNVEGVINDRELAGRLRDPRNKHYQPTTAPARLLRSLKGVVGVIEKIDNVAELGEFDEYFHWLGRIEKGLKRLQTKGAKVNGRKGKTGR